MQQHAQTHTGQRRGCRQWWGWRLTHRCVLLLLCFWAVGASQAAVDIADLPARVGDRYDLTWTLTLMSPTTPLRLAIEAPRLGMGAYLTLTPTQLRWHSAGQQSPDEVCAPVTLAVGTPALFTLVRRPGVVAVLQDHRTVLIAPSGDVPHGTVTFGAVPPGMRLADVRYHEVGVPRFGDDFMRPEALEQRLYTPSAGWTDDDIWQTDTPATNRGAINPWQLSLFPSSRTTANAFWLLYTGAGSSQVVADPLLCSPHWDAYRVQVATCLTGEGETGLLAAYQDSRTYLRFRWRSTGLLPTDPVGGTLEAVIGGQVTSLGTCTARCVPGQWYALRLQVGWERLQVVIDEQVVLDVPNPGLIQGRVGLYGATGDALNESYVAFDDVAVRPWQTLDLLSASPAFVTQTGRWQREGDTLRAVSRGTVCTRSTQWSHYTADARLSIPPAGTCSLLIHAQGHGVGYQWVISGTEHRLYRLRGAGTRQLIARTARHGTPTTGIAVRIEADGPYLACMADDVWVFDAYDPTVTRGACGLKAFSPGVKVYTFHLTERSEAPGTRMVGDGFAQDRWAMTWASADADWFPAAALTGPLPVEPKPDTATGNAFPAPTDQPGVYWRKGGSYHAVRITVPVLPSAMTGQTVHLTSGYTLNGGYRISLQEDVTHRRLQVSCRREDTVIGTCTLPLTPRGALVIERHGTWLLLWGQVRDPEGPAAEAAVLRESLLWRYQDAAPLAGEQVALTVTDPRIPAAAVQVQSARLDDAFEQAPTGWVPLAGTWGVMARYTCDPRWNWYGGYGAGVPAVRSKTRLEGDQTVEAYLAVKMDYPGATQAYRERFRDFGVAICTDGTDPQSGYAVLRAGRRDGQPATLLLRKGVIVAESRRPEDLLPAQGVGHRQWFATRLEQHGNTITVFLDHHQALTYTDPDPLAGGYPAVWSLDNGILVGRITLTADRMVPAGMDLTPTTAAQDKGEDHDE